MIDEINVEDFFLSGLVISNRLFKIAQGDCAAGEEAAKMVAEKVDAVHDGMTAVAMNWWKFSWDMALNPMAPATWTNPADTFAGPGRKTLRANAQRLTGYRR
ncbi:MAG: hypothetical protein AAF788_06520 [Pseudomonadota bacterium]